jgi:RNA polymerase sigma-70 factor (ECF subfamily)
MDLNSELTEKAKRDYVFIRQAIENNDRQAYAKLMGFYRDSIYFMLLKMTHNKEDAEDLTIEAFGKAFKSIKQYSPNFAFSTWLFRIASNNCIDFLRKKNNNTLSIDKEYRDEEGTELASRLESDDINPQESLVREQKIDVIRQVVEKIKPHYRVLIELRYFKEYSYEEISAELDMPIGTVKAKLFRARDLLYNIVKGSEDKF